MKTSSYKLKIDEPCNQSWANMEKNEQGRFCLKCTKSVIDFTKLSDAEIINFLKSNSGSVCGRLNKSQVNRNLVLSYAPNKNNFIYKFFASLLFVGLADKAMAQGDVIVLNDSDRVETENTQISITGKEFDTTKEKIKKERVLKGLVLDSVTREFISFANIVVVGTNITSTTNLNGEFQLSIPEDLVDSAILKILYVGFKMKEVPLKKIDFNTGSSEFLLVEEFTLERVNYTMGVMAYGEPIKKKKFWQFWKKK